MKKILLGTSILLLSSCSTNTKLVEYNLNRMDTNEKYLKSIEERTEKKVQKKGTVKRVPLEKEAEKWLKDQ